MGVIDQLYLDVPSVDHRRALVVNQFQKLRRAQEARQQHIVYCFQFESLSLICVIHTFMSLFW